MTSEQRVKALVPNYRIHTAEVYFSLPCHLIERDRNLDILGFCGLRGDVPLSSWVPDWTAKLMPKPLLRRTLDSSGRTKGLYSAANNTELMAIMKMAFYMLQGLNSMWVYWISVPRYYNSGLDQDIALSWQAAAFSPWSHYITGCTRQEALAHTMCADVKDFGEDPQGYSLLGKRLNSIPIPPHGDDLGIFAWPDPRVRDATIQRLLFFTEKGYMGLAPYTAQPSDKVCLLNGAQFPIILRRKEDYWTVIGESYIHGIMDGEGWREMLSAQNTEQKLQSFRVM